MEEYLTGKKASKVLGVHQKTLYAWVDDATHYNPYKNICKAYIFI